MLRKIFNYFEIAAKTAESKIDQRHFLLGAVAIRADGAIVKSLNRPCQNRNRLAHAEKLITRKLDYGSTVYVARVRLDNGTFGMARPCPDCLKAMISMNVKKIYYTISSIEFGTIYLQNREIVKETVKEF